MKKEPKVSIIMPAYNAEKYIAAAIESVLRQNFRNFELIVVNDGSTDSTAGVIERLSETDSRIRVFHKIKNSGAGPARNVGLENAKGKYIMFCDSDDSFEPRYVRKMMREMERSGADFVKTGIKTVAESKSCFNKHDYLLYDKILRRDIVEKYGIRFSSLETSEDISFMLRYTAVSNKAIYVKKRFYCHFLRENSLIGRIGHSVRMLKNDISAFREALRFAIVQKCNDTVDFCRKQLYRKKIILVSLISVCAFASCSGDDGENEPFIDEISSSSNNSYSSSSSLEISSDGNTQSSSSDNGISSSDGLSSGGISSSDGLSSGGVSSSADGISSSDNGISSSAGVSSSGGVSSSSAGVSSSSGISSSSGVSSSSGISSSSNDVIPVSVGNYIKSMNAYVPAEGDTIHLDPAEGNILPGTSRARALAASSNDDLIRKYSDGQFLRCETLISPMGTSQLDYAFDYNTIFNVNELYEDLQTRYANGGFASVGIDFGKEDASCRIAFLQYREGDVTGYYSEHSEGLVFSSDTRVIEGDRSQISFYKKECDKTKISVYDVYHSKGKAPEVFGPNSETPGEAKFSIVRMVPNDVWPHTDFKTKPLKGYCGGKRR